MCISVPDGRMAGGAGGILEPIGIPVFPSSQGGLRVLVLVTGFHLPLDLLERDAFGLREKEQHHEELVAHSWHTERRGDQDLSGFERGATDPGVSVTAQSQTGTGSVARVQYDVYAPLIGGSVPCSNTLNWCTLRRRS